MSRQPRILLSIFIIFLLHSNFTRAEADLKESWEATKKLISDVPLMEPVVDLWNFFEKSFVALKNQNTESEEEARHNVLRMKMDQINRNLDEVMVNLAHKLDKSDALNDFKHKMENFEDSINAVKDRHDEYLDLVASGLVKDDNHRKTFSEVVMNGYHPMQTLLRKIHRTFYGPFDNFRRSLIQYMKDHELPQTEIMCWSKKSIQQLIYEYFQEILEAEMKGYMMSLYVTSKVGDDRGNNSKFQINDKYRNYVRNISIERVSGLVNYTKTFLKDMPRELWKCNLENGVEGIDYVKFGPIFDKYIMFEEYLHTEHQKQELYEKAVNWDDLGHISAGGGDGHIGAMAQAKEVDDRDYRCMDTLRDCGAGITGITSYCPANRTFTGKHQRYTYVKYNDFEWGEKCTPSKSTPWGLQVHRSGIENGWYTHTCTCPNNDEDLLRFVHTEWVRADTDNVITGVRIVPANNTFYLQIKQGKFLSNSAVVSVDWKPINYLKSSDYKDFKSSGSNSKLIKLSYGNKRILLDDATTDWGTLIMTGVRFAPTSTGFRIDAEYSSFSPDGGFLLNNNDLYGHAKWTYTALQRGILEGKNGKPLLELEKKRYANISELESVVNRTKINLDNLDFPTMPKHMNNEINTPNKDYIDLTQTRLDIDFGSNILPYVDIRPIETFPPTPLSGIGLTHRASKGSGGYLALKLITYNFTNLIKDAPLFPRNV